MRRGEATYLAVRGLEEWILTPVSTAWARLQLWCWGVEGGRSLRVCGRLRLRVRGRMELGRGVSINSGRFNYVGIANRVSIWVSASAFLRIGDGCGLSNCTIVCTDGITIGENTFIGGGTRIYDTDFHPLDAGGRLSGHAAPSAPVTIGRRVFVGGHCTVLKGVTIGDEAIVAAGSIVTRDIPSAEVWGGVPAKRIRSLGEPTTSHG